MKRFVCILLVLLSLSNVASASLYGDGGIKRVDATQTYIDEIITDYLERINTKYKSEDVSEEEFELFVRYSELYFKMLRIMYLEIGTDRAMEIYDKLLAYEMIPQIVLEQVQNGDATIKTGISVIINMITESAERFEE